MNRRLWVILLPVLVDLFLWLGPPVSPQPAAGHILNQVGVQGLENQVRTMFQGDLSRRLPVDLRVVADRLNLLGTLVGTVVAPQPPMPQATWHIGSPWLLIAAVLVINGISLLVSAVYLVSLGDAVRKQQEQKRFFWRGLQSFGRMAGVVFVWGGIALMTIMPFLIIGGLVSVLSQVFGSLVIVFGFAVLLWMYFTAQFAFDAVVISNAGARRALLGSVLVVRRWFWSSLGLLLLSYVIAAGFGFIWQKLAELGTVGLLIAMVGSAYIGAGLAATHLLFYRDRIQPAGGQQRFDAKQEIET